ncbi:uncharacterized protein LOC128606896 [Ictalurus furcatus]|uniref:uncharacterized protein LOC128606896 n=1 Tax=Ictalurus furcatus TaxID=66913 RepID=UPI002350ABC3|nr:uncharacterized protein LOC128606896 [Ictalurus furcatus]
MVIKLEGPQMKSRTVISSAFALCAGQHPFLLPSFHDAGLVLNTCYQLAHLSADLTLLVESLAADPGVSGFPPPLHYRIVPATVCMDASTQTETSSVVSSVNPFELTPDEDMAFSGADPDFNPTSDSLSPTPYSPSSPKYSPASSLHSLSQYSQSPSPIDYSPTSPLY